MLLFFVIDVDCQKEGLSLEVFGHLAVDIDILAIVGLLVADEQQIVRLDVATKDLLCGLLNGN